MSCHPEWDPTLEELVARVEGHLHFVEDRLVGKLRLVYHPLALRALARRMEERDESRHSA